MKTVSHLFLLCSLFLLVACGGQTFESKKTHHLETSHEYGTNKQNQEARPSSGEVVKEEDAYNLYRDLWQNPLEVIEQLGDLEGKVVADIGAGPYGYFTVQIASKTNASKVIAIDIEQDAIDYIEKVKTMLDEDIQKKIVTRLVEPEDPKLGEGEVDIVLIVNTAIYFNDRVAYFKNLIKGLTPTGKLVILDYKMRNTPVGPPLDSRIPLGRIEEDLARAGYKSIEADDRTLEYQYIVIAGK